MGINFNFYFRNTPWHVGNIEPDCREERKRGINFNFSFYFRGKCRARLLGLFPLIMFHKFALCFLPSTPQCLLWKSRVAPRTGGHHRPTWRS